MGGSSYDRDVYSGSSYSGSSDWGASNISSEKLSSSVLNSTLDPTGKILTSNAKYPKISHGLTLIVSMQNIQ
jgi:hypothetical protein